MEAQSERVHVAYHVFARFGADLHAQSVLVSKISASELRRKFIKSWLGMKEESPVSVMDESMDFSSLGASQKKKVVVSFILKRMLKCSALKK